MGNEIIDLSTEDGMWKKCPYKDKWLDETTGK